MTGAIISEYFWHFEQNDFRNGNELVLPVLSPLLHKGTVRKWLTFHHPLSECGITSKNVEEDFLSHFTVVWTKLIEYEKDKLDKGY